MNKQAKSKKRRERIKYRIRKKIMGTPERPRLVIYRSLNHIYAQVIDDLNAKTLAYVGTSSKEIADKVKSVKGKIEKSKEIGKLIGEKAKSMNINDVVFDRNGYLYHGRVKALADGARESGLNF